MGLEIGHALSERTSSLLAKQTFGKSCNLKDHGRSRATADNDDERAFNFWDGIMLSILTSRRSIQHFNKILSDSPKAKTL